MKRFEKISLFLGVTTLSFLLCPIFFTVAADENLGDYLVKVEDTQSNANEKSSELSSWVKVENVTIGKLDTLKNNSSVLTIQKEIEYKLLEVPDDPEYSSVGSFFSGEYDQWNLRKIGLLPKLGNFTSAWDYSSGTSSTTVAVIDSGIDLSHPDLQSNIWVNSSEANGIAGVDDDNNGYTDDVNGYNFYSNSNNLTDFIGHGTHVSGIISAVTNNSTGVAGICWDCKLMVLKVFETTNTTNDLTIAEAIYYAVDNEANVINLSLSGVGYSAVLQEAIDYAWVNGVTVVAASGNDAADTSFYSPAGLKNVIAVGATDKNDLIGSFSNVGPKVDIVAPGVFVLSTKLRSLGSGGCISSSSYYCLSGTSMSSPHVAGVAALLFSYHKDDATPWDNLKIRYALLKNVDDKGTTGFDNYFGFGRLNALHSLQVNSLNLTTSVPTLTLNTPSNNYFSNKVTLQGSVSSNDLYMYNLDFSSFGSTIYSYTGRGNVNNANLIDQNIDFSEGTYDVTLSAEDFSGSKSNTLGIQINVDLTPPQNFNVNSTTSWLNSKRQTYSWQSTSDTSGQAVSYTLLLDNINKASNILSNSYSLAEDIADGVHTWYVIAKDKAGNTRSSNTAQIKIDTTPPNVFSLSKVTNNATATFTFTMSDELSGMSHFEVSIDNGAYVTKTSPYTTSTLANGDHNIKVKGFDNAGNIRLMEGNFTIDSRLYMLKSVGDLSGDGTIDLSDLSILATYWNQNNDLGDVNHDGKVDLSDLSIVAQNWQKTF